MAGVTSCNDPEHKLFHLRSETGINFVNQLTPTADLNILTYLYYYNGAGVASGDFNNDGLVDLYFTGNQVQDKLYLNKGELSADKVGFQFEDITEKAGIDNHEGWTTGITLVDINNDGLLDIYICKVGAYQNIKGKNLLYINQGFKNDGFPTFIEDAKTYNLDIVNFSTQSSFFDYDLDGDLDMFLLNHSVFPNRTYGKGKLRHEADNLSGDKLFKNENGKFIEVSKEAGIFQGKIGYGLGVSISDINNDGYPDIYVGNDFFENDYLYVNQKDGTFEEIISKNDTKLGHTTHYSMGNDIADLNNDGLTDIISLDMLPEDIETYKMSGSEFNNQIYDQYLKNGYHPQYMQNTLHLNRGNTTFSEIAFAAGIAATDWSWAPLIVDLDNDGFKDIFISNGIKGATNDMDFMNFIANEKIQERINMGMNHGDLAFTKEIPEKKLSNYFFKSNKNLTFSNVTDLWFDEIPSFSNGAIYADLDHDGDLDIVVNNVNEKAFIIENKSEINTQNNFLKIRFEGNPKNRFGIGAKVIVSLDTTTITHENFLSKGYLSAVSPDMTIGIGKHTIIDSLTVIWPGGKYQTLENIQPNSSIILKYFEAKGDYYKSIPNNGFLTNVKSSINFEHQELPSYEFNREPLIPYTKGYEGPKIAIGDVNGDGLDDIYIGGAKKQSGALHLQNEGGSFSISPQMVFEKNNIHEDTDNLFFDADSDGDQDLLVVSGGNEFRSGVALNPRLYLNEGGIFNLSSAFNNIEINASVVKAFDFDADGDQDIVMGANSLPQQFGKSAKNYIFENDGQGNFKDISATNAVGFSNVGLIEDIEMVDVNGDGLLDIIAVGHWMPISIFINDGEDFKLQSNNNLEHTNGWWNTIKATDFDDDGDIDFVAGNWGLNTRLKASKQRPIQLYRNDFDNNYTVEPIVTYYSQGKETVFSSKEELTKQLPLLNKKFLSYAEFAKADFSELFSEEKINNAYKKQVYELASCYFENTGNGAFKRKRLPFLSQTSSIKTLYLSDFNGDGFNDILVAGNEVQISTQLGRLDALHGILLLNDQRGFFTVKANQSFDISGPARDIEKLKINGTEYFVVSINNSVPVFLRDNEYQK